MTRYVKLIIRKPKLVLHSIYKKHLGVILCTSIKEIKSTSIMQENYISLVKSDDPQEITNFYQKMGRNSINKTTVQNWINKGFECFLIYDDETVIGGTWIFKNEFELKQLSGRTLSKNKKIKFQEDAVYKCYTIIDSDYRGKGLNQFLIKELLNYYSNSNYNKLIAITGANNGSYIRSTMKCGGTLIGIVQIRNILGLVRRKEIFLDFKEKSWQ